MMFLCRSCVSCCDSFTTMRRFASVAIAVRPQRPNFAFQVMGLRLDARQRVPVLHCRPRSSPAASGTYARPGEVVRFKKPAQDLDGIRVRKEQARTEWHSSRHPTKQYACIGSARTPGEACLCAGYLECGDIQCCTDFLASSHLK